MDDFSRLLAYFQDANIDSLVLQSDKAIAVVMQGELRGVTKKPLPDRDLRRILYTSPLAPQIDALGQNPIEVPINAPCGTELIAILSPHRDGLHCMLHRASKQRAQRQRFSIPVAVRSMSTQPPARGATLRAQGAVPPVDDPAASGQTRRATGPPGHASVRRPTAPPAHGTLSPGNGAPPRLERVQSRPQTRPDASPEPASSRLGEHAATARPSTRPPSAGGSARPSTRPPSAGGSARLDGRRSEAGPGQSPPARARLSTAPPSAGGAARPSTRPPAARPGQSQPAASAPSSTASARASEGPPTPCSSPGTAPKSVPRSLDELLGYARQIRASDLHLSSESPALLRCLGQLKRHGYALSDHKVRGMVDKMLDEDSKAQLQALGYADFALEHPTQGRFRVNVCRHKHGIKACLRVLPQAPPTMESLGLPDELCAVLKHHQGLAIIAGPNGQGKSTTLAALVHKLNQEKAIHIITVEDPIEICHGIGKAVISQRQVGRDTKSFQSALKAALREDPDVIVLGELRDKETVEMALSAAETGHLVIATMNTPSGAKTIGRLIDLFPPDDQSQVRATLAGTLMVVAAQRLVPNLDQSDMVAAIEIISGGVPLWSLIRDDKLVQLPGLMQRGKSLGMISLQDSLRSLHARGLIDELTMQRAVAQQKGPEASIEPPKEEIELEEPSNASPGAGLRNLFSRKSS